MWKALVTLSLVRPASSDSLKQFYVVDADMHDGDKKEVSVSGTFVKLGSSRRPSTPRSAMQASTSTILESPTLHQCV